MRRRRPLLLLVPLLAAAVAVGVLVTGSTAERATAASGSPQAGSDRWAFIVGVSDYAGRTSSTVAGADDAADFRELLLRNGFREDRIRTITDTQATARNVRAGLQWLVDNSSPESFSVFHFSGHVKQLGGDRDRDGEKVDEYLWPHDNVFISDAELANRVQQLRGLAWIDVAGCEAGGFDDGISAPTRVFTGSSTETEKSYEHPDWRNSVFTGLEVDQAWLQGQADHDGNGKISIQEAFAFAHERAPKVTAGQRRGAQHPVSSGGDGSQWFLDGPPPPPAPAAPADDGRCHPIICFRQ